MSLVDTNSPRVLPFNALIALLFLPSLLLSQEFNLDHFIRTHYEKWPDSTVARVAHDSLQYELYKDSLSGMSIHVRRVIVSHDGKLTLFQFEGEGCGAYCNPFFNTVAVMTTAESHLTHSLSLDFQIEDIEILEEGKDYLVMGTSYGRARGIEAVWGKTATLVQLSDSIQTVWSGQAYTSNLVEIDAPEANLTFDPENQTVELNYDWYSEQDDFRSYHATMLYLYTGETFVKDQVEVIWHDEMEE